MNNEVNWSQYLESICTEEKYQGWQDFYTPTDALHRQPIENKQLPRRLNLSLMVQTIMLRETEASGEDNEVEKEQVERLEVLAGLRKYADNHVLLVGKPGSGKSTALERLLWEEAQKARTQPQAKIPVLVELRRYKTSVLGIIRDFLFQNGCRLNETEIEQLLLAGRFLLLVDGWNELPDDKARGDVKIFREKYQRFTPMIFTTRELAGDIGIEKKLEMQPLTEAQMRQFVLTYLPEEGERLLQQLQGRLRELGETPLLLWMLCELFNNTGNIPPNLGLVFRCFAQSYDSQIKQDVSTDESRSRWFLLLQHLAFEMMRGKTATDLRVTIPKQEAEDILTQFLSTKKFVKPRECAFNWLNDLLKYHLIQLTNSNREIEFHHQLLQEYYAAERLLVQLPKLSDDTLKRDYLNYLKWTEPLALMLALVQDEEQALRVVKLALEVDLQLGARLAGEVKLEFQEKTVDLVVKLEIPQILKIELLGLTRSKKAVYALVLAFNSAESNLRNKVVEALGSIGNLRAVHALIKGLDDEESSVRHSAALILGKVRNKAAIPALIQTLNDSDSSVRRSAAFALGNISNPQAVAALAQALNDESSSVHWIAAEALGNIDNEIAVLALMQALNHKKHSVRWRAAEVLGNMGNEAAVSHLIQALNNQKYFYRGSAALALGNIGNQEAVLALMQVLSHKNYDIDVCWKAAKALGNIGKEAAVLVLIQALNHERFSVRRKVAEILGEIGNEAGVSPLIQALNDEDSSIRNRAAESLGNIGNEAAVSPLIQALNDEDSSVRGSAAEALGKIGNEAAISPLIQVLDDEDYDVCSSAAKAIGNIGSQAAVSRLIQKLNDEDSYIRESAAEALGNIGDEAAVSPLIQALNDEDSSVRGSAAEALGKIGNQGAFLYLIQALNDENSYVRYNAVEALGKIGNEAAVPHLSQALNDRDFHVRLSALYALEEIGNNAAILQLIQALDNEMDIISLAVAEALADIGKPEFLPCLTPYLQQTGSALNVLLAITGIQKRCRYYNYQIYESPVTQEQKPENPIIDVLSAVVECFKSWWN